MYPDPTTPSFSPYMDPAIPEPGYAVRNGSAVYITWSMETLHEIDIGVCFGLN